jgi:phosphoribosylanthranilate isomerase
MLNEMIIKVCGLRDTENINQINQLDVDFMGFIFYPKSPRFVNDKDIGAIASSNKHRVGVFVNEEYEVIIEKAHKLGLSHIQLHGNESSELSSKLKNTGLTIIKSLSISGKDDFRSTDDYSGKTDYFLFDTKCSGFGGSGKKFDWSLLGEYKGDIPFLLSGGLNPGSIDELKELGHPQFAGIDLNSGFEISPALKDIWKLKAFITEFRRINQK